MEGEIDLRPYIEALARRWYWIVGTAVVAAVVTFAIISIRPPTYEATALVAIVNPQDVVLESLTVESVDPLLRSVYDTNPLVAVYPELAVSDGLLQVLLTQINPPLEGVEGVDDLREMLVAEPGSDASLLRLSVRYQDADKAAHVTNAWAELFVPWANEIYGNGGTQRLRFFEEQLAQALTDVESAEAALIAFQAVNRLTILENSLASHQEMQMAYLSTQRQVKFLLQDVQNLHDQIAQSGSNTVNFADQLTGLNLQLSVFNAENAAPVQLQINPETFLTAESRQAQLAFLDGLITSLEARAVDAELQLAALEPEILELQQAKQEAETESNHLLRNHDAAIEEYTALTRAVTEERISAEDVSSGVRLASQAAVPQKPEGSNRVINTIIAGVVAFLAGIFFLLAMEWWQSVQRDLNVEVKREQKLAQS